MVVGVDATAAPRPVPRHSASSAPCSLPSSSCSVPALWKSAARTGHVYRCLQDEKEIAKLRALQLRVLRSRGPHASLSVLTAGSGGHATVTSSGASLLPGMHVGSDSVVLGMVVGCGRAQSSTCGDASLLSTGLALSLLHEGSQHVSVQRRLLAEAYSALLQHSLSILASPCFPAVYTLPAASLQHLRSLASTVITSKPGPDYWPGDVDHLSSVLLDGYLRSDVSDANSLQIVCMEPGQSIQQTYLAPGLLYPTPHIPYSRRHRPRPAGEGVEVKVALFNVSMAGDSNESVTADIHVQDGVDSTVLSCMQACADRLLSLGVGVVGCQRVIHPSILHKLHSEGVVVLDRLSIRYIYSMHSLAGGTLLGSFSSDIEEGDLGSVSRVDHVLLQNRSYIQLSKHASHVNTLLLNNRSEAGLSELRGVCESCVSVLRSVSVDSRVLAGAGCWQTCLAHTLHKQMLDGGLVSLQSSLGCSTSQLWTAVSSFCTSLISVRPAPEPGVIQYIDRQHHHLWNRSDVKEERCHITKTTCACGAIPYSQQLPMCELIETLFDQKSSCNDTLSTKASNSPLSQRGGSKSNSLEADIAFVAGNVSYNGHVRQNYVDRHLPKTDTPTETSSTNQQSPCTSILPRYLDSYAICVNAVKLGVEIAVMILGVNNIIHDVN